MQGRLTLLLGPPSCGKTTFLNALAGRLHQKEYSGSVTYNGHTFEDFCAERSVAFVEQTDTHIPILTAVETAEFAYDLQHGPRGAPPAPCNCLLDCLLCLLLSRRSILAELQSK